MVARIITLVAALLVAAVGAALVILYARQADERAAEQYELVKVLVARENLPAGTPLGTAIETQRIASSDIVKGARLDGAIPGPALPSDLATYVLTYPLFQGEQLTLSKVGPPGQDRGGLEPVLADGTSPNPVPTPTPRPDGRNAVTVTIDEDARGTEFIAPGSLVSVFVTLQRPSPGSDEPSDQTCVLIKRAEIIAVGSATTTTVTEAAAAAAAQAARGDSRGGGASLVSIDVTQETASKIIEGQALGKLYFVNLPSVSEGFEEGEKTCRSDDTLFDDLPGVP